MENGDAGGVFSNRWKVLDLLGEGGGGRVWRVRDLANGDEAALKQVRVQSETQQVRFRRELAALQALRIPGVVRLLEVGEHRGDPFLVTELVRGRPFPGISGRCSWSELREPTLRLLDTVARVHAAGILHRDLKPANVLVDDEGRVTILDFGLARGTPGDRTVTGERRAVGTPRYLAPEQLAGSQVDGRADLYAVGVMLFDALTGTDHLESAWFASTPATAGFPPISQLEPGIPAPVAETIDALLQDRPAARPGNAAEVRHRLAGGEAEGFGLVVPALEIGALLDDVVAEVLRGQRVSIAGGRGLGRSRFCRELTTRLLSRGIASCTVGAGRRPLTSLRPVVGEAAFAEGPVAAEDALRARLGRGDVVLVDGADTVDAWSKRMLERVTDVGVIVYVGVREAERELKPLPLSALRSLFGGLDLLFHVGEDAAALLFERTDGVPERVVRELDAWLAVGLARREGGKFILNREQIEQLASARVLAPEPARELDDELDPGLVELLSWLALAGDVGLPALAEALALPAWEVEVGVEELCREGLARRLPNGNLRAIATPRSLHTWPEDQRVFAHAQLAAVAPAASEARLVQLLAAGDLQAASICAIACARSILATGRAARAFGVIHPVLARALPVLDDPGPLVRACTNVAVVDGVGATLRTMLLTLERHEARVDPAVCALIRSQLLVHAGEYEEARRQAQAHGPIADLDLEGMRYAMLVRCANRLGYESADAVIDEFEARHPHNRDVARRVAIWRGLIAYYRMEFSRSAEQHRLAESLATTPVERALALGNLGGTLLELPDLPAAAACAAELEALASELRLSRFEAIAVTTGAQARYRARQPVDLPEALLEASEVAGDSVRHVSLCNVMAADAYRAGDLDRSRRLSAAARKWAEIASWPPALAFSRSFRVLLRAPDADVHAAVESVTAVKAATVRAQCFGMIAAVDPAAIAPYRDEVVATASRMPAPEVWRDVISPAEILEFASRA